MKEKRDNLFVRLLTSKIENSPSNGQNIVRQPILGCAWAWARSSPLLIQK